jgi:hypothetical protein
MKKLNFLLIILIIITIVLAKKVYSQSNSIQLVNPTILKNEIRFILNNKEKENIYVNSVEIAVKDNEENIIYKSLIPINKTIQKENSIEIKHKTNYDLSNSNKIDYSIK